MARLPNFTGAISIGTLFCSALIVLYIIGPVSPPQPEEKDSNSFVKEESVQVRNIPDAVIP